MEPFGQDRPLWQLTFVTGLSRRHVALLDHVHHAMADGVAGVDVATVLLDVSRDTRPTDGPESIGEPQSRASRLVPGRDHGTGRGAGTDGGCCGHGPPPPSRTAPPGGRPRPGAERRDEPWPPRSTFDAESSNRTGPHLDVRSPAARRGQGHRARSWARRPMMSCSPPLPAGSGRCCWQGASSSTRAQLHDPRPGVASATLRRAERSGIRSAHCCCLCRSASEIRRPGCGRSHRFRAR